MVILFNTVFISLEIDFVLAGIADITNAALWGIPSWFPLLANMHTCLGFFKGHDRAIIFL